MIWRTPQRVFECRYETNKTPTERNRHHQPRSKTVLGLYVNSRYWKVSSLTGKTFILDFYISVFHFQIVGHYFLVRPFRIPQSSPCIKILWIISSVDHIINIRATVQSFSPKLLHPSIKANPWTSQWLKKKTVLSIMLEEANPWLKDYSRMKLLQEGKWV